MQDENFVPVVAIEDAAGGLHNLAVAGASQLLRATAALRVGSQSLDMTDDALDEFRSCDGIFQCDEIGNAIQIAERALRPDYFIHRARRFLA